MAKRNLTLTTDRLVSDLKNLVTDSELLVREAGNELNARGKQARDRLTESLESAKETCRMLQDKTMEQIEAADELAHEHPYRFAGIALAVGLLLGLLAGRGK